MPRVLCGRASGAVTFREERRLKTFENVVLRKTLVSRREDVTGDRGKLHVLELHDLYSTPSRHYQPANKIKEKRLAKMWCGEEQEFVQLLCEDRQMRENIGRPRRRREVNIKVDLKYIGGMAWAGLTFLLAACNEPSGSIKCAEFLD